MIELKGISRFYNTGGSGVKALDNVSLRIEQGEFVAIIGPSGSGKSTLMHVLGFLDRPDSGQYLFLGKDTSRLSDDELAIIRNRFLGFVFQQFHLLPRLDAVGNAMLPLIYAGRSSARHQAVERIASVGLAARGDHRPNQLSGGEQQRVAIARSLVNDPLLIMADEPTGNLDSKSEEEIVAIIKKLNSEGKTIIMVTHEKEVAVHASRIIQMRDGRIVSDETSVKTAVPAARDVPDLNSFMHGERRRSGGAGILDHIRQASATAFAHKVRSFLSMLGILIGVAAVIAMLSIAQGAQDAIKTQLASLGSNLIMVFPAGRRIQGVALQMGQVNGISCDDAEALGELEHVKRYSPTVQGQSQVAYANKNWNTQILGVGLDYAEMRASVPVTGRFFTKEELDNRAKVAVLGTTVARELFGAENPVGKTMKIDRVNALVIGVMPPKGSGRGRDQDDVVVIPNLTGLYRIIGKRDYNYVDIEVDDQANIESVTDAVKTTMAKRKRIPESRKDETVWVNDMTEVRDSMNKTADTMSMLLGAIAAISLLVGGIGIMNIMIVSVTERTKEIGLRKALGARGYDIMVQFLIEAVIMTVTGGVFGVLFGTGAAKLCEYFAGWPVTISVPYTIVAVVFSGMVGIIFGLWPARQASKLDPIKALRYE